MNTIIAGTRAFVDLEYYEIIANLIKEEGIKITTVLCGHAPGIDSLGELYALDNQIPIKSFPAKWNVLDNVDPRYIKISKYGKKYNCRAGLDRNELMAKNADALILIWDGKSSGSSHMKSMAIKYNLKIYEKVV